MYSSESKDMKMSSQPLSGSLYHQLRKDILQGRFQRGEKLTEQALCETYQMSRTPVREALRQLELEGLIEAIPNRGAFVVGLSQQDIRDLYEMRKEYEILAVRWAIQRITPEGLSQLEEAYEFMEFYTMKKEAEKMLNINSKFHELIYEAAGNRILYNALSTYQAYIKQTKTNTTYVDGYLEQVLAEHKAIYEAFKARDPEAGAAAVTAHMEAAKVRANFI